PRIAALQQVDQSLAALRHDHAEEARASVQFLSAAVATELGRHADAEEAYRRALHTDEKGPFADDAAFAAIRSAEAQGRDADAARDWLKWEKTYPRSPLIHEARLA